MKKGKDRSQMMLNEPMSRVIPRMAIPTIVAFLINSIYSLTDTYFVSSLGTNATAAVSVNASLDSLILMAGSVMAIGANSYIARLLGAKDDKKASSVLSTAFFCAISLGLLLMALGLGFMKPMVRLLGSTPTCEQYAIEYATYVLMAAPFMTGNFVMNQCLRAEGSAVLSMIGMGVGGIINCVLDPIFIFGMDLGVKGASLATAISKLISFAILIYPYLAKRSMLRISIKRCRFNRDILGQIVTIGSASMFRTGLAVVSSVILNNIAGAISDAALAGIGVANKVMMFPFSIILGFGSGFQPVAGFNWGAKRYDRVLDSYRYSAKVAIVGAAVIGLLLGVFANPVIRLFSEADPEMQRIGALCIILQSIALPIQAWVMVVNMFCAGLGYAKGALILASSRQGSCFIPVVFIMASLWGIYGVTAVQAVADVLTLALAIPLIRHMFKKVRIAAAEEPAA